MDETPATHHQLLQQGQTAIHRGAFNEALRCFKEVYEAAPGDLRAAVGLGMTVALSGESQRGIDMLTALVDQAICAKLL